MTIKVLCAMHGQNVSFVWASGGHSADAPQGNFFNQSYTVYKNRDAVVAVFAAVGMEVIGMSSAPEESIFGSDIDVLNWD